jgi:hypothetical protein
VAAFPAENRTIVFVLNTLGSATSVERAAQGVVRASATPPLWKYLMASMSLLAPPAV